MDDWTIRRRSGMRGNGKVFISHAHDDNARCAPLLAALDVWGVDYWFDTRRMEAGDDLAHAIQTAIRERDIFIRVCTPAAQRSYWVGLETGAFRGLQARGHREGRENRASSRVLINLIIAAEYEPEPFDYAHIFVDAARKPEAEWLEELRRALGVGVGARPAQVAGEEAAPLPERLPADLPGDEAGALSVHAGGKGALRDDRRGGGRGARGRDDQHLAGALRRGADDHEVAHAARDGAARGGGDRGPAGERAALRGGAWRDSWADAATSGRQERGLRGDRGGEGGDR